MARILLANCAVLDAAAGVVRPGLEVLVEGDRVVQVAERASGADGARRLDAGDRTVLPGLIDAHVHVTAVTTNLALLETLPASLVTARAIPILEGMLARGFTTVRDVGGADAGLARAIEEGLVRGPRLFPSGKALSQTGGHADLRPPFAGSQPCACGRGPALGRIADGVAAVRQAVRDELRKGATQIKVMASGGVASPTDPVAWTQYSTEELRAAVEEAEAAHTYVTVHAYTARAIRRAVESGVRSIEHANLIDPETARLVAARGAYVVPTLVTYDALARAGRRLGFPEVSLKKLGDVREAGLASLRILAEAGVPLGFGTDLLGELHAHQSEEFGLRARALTPAEVLRSATVTNAALLQRPGELGVVAPGALADLLVVDGNPLEDLGLLGGQGAHLSLIMKGGRLVKNRLRA